MFFARRYKKGLESTFFLFRPLTKLPHPNTMYQPGVGSWVLASELCESGQRGDVHICVSLEGGVLFFLNILFKLGPWPSGTGTTGVV